MIPAERQKEILYILSQYEVISINELIEILDVSHMTIRRDITKLEEQEKVISVPGGVQLTQVLRDEPTYDKKLKLNSKEKSVIGKIASQFVPLNATVYLDAGTTTLEVARYLAHRSDLLCITNDFTILSFLSNASECELYHTGGLVERNNQSCIGSKVADFILSMNIDIAFTSTSSWDLRGISTPSEPKIFVKKSVASAAKKNILVSDSSKYGRIASFRALDIESFDLIITDSYFPESVKKELQDKGIQVLTCDL